MRNFAQGVVVVVLAMGMFSSGLASFAMAQPSGAAPQPGCSHHPLTPKAPGRTPASLICCVTGHNAARPVAAFPTASLEPITVAASAPVVKAQHHGPDARNRDFQFLPRLIPLRV